MIFEKRSGFLAPVSALDLWHRSPGAFNRLSPPWEKVEILREMGELTDGAIAEIGVRIGLFRLRWIAEHRDVRPGEEFTDVQLKGPFAAWKHRHIFEESSAGSCRLTDRVEYELPFGAVGGIFGGRTVRKKLDRMFEYRHTVTRHDLERADKFPDPKPLTILVTGGTGLVGSALCPYLRQRGHHVHCVTRSPKRDSDIGWDPDRGTIDWDSSRPVDAIVHLAGENVGEGHWTKRKKDRILKSRENGTRTVSEFAANLKEPPEVLISMSGSSYYRSGPDRPHTESGPAGDQFLTRVCQVWEDAAEPAKSSGIRVVYPRLGIALTPAGGALKKLLPLFQAGLGGRIGSGNQRLSWIAMDDVIDILHRLILDKKYKGPVNLCAPTPCSNRDFTTTLARVLRRPALLPVPAFALRLAFGEMADGTLLDDVAIAPGVLTDHGYRFRFPDLEGALCHLLGRKPLK